MNNLDANTEWMLRSNRWEWHVLSSKYCLGHVSEGPLGPVHCQYSCEIRRWKRWECPLKCLRDDIYSVEQSAPSPSQTTKPTLENQYLHCRWKSSLCRRRKTWWFTSLVGRSRGRDIRREHRISLGSSRSVRDASNEAQTLSTTASLNKAKWSERKRCRPAVYREDPDTERQRTMSTFWSHRQSVGSRRVY